MPLPIPDLDDRTFQDIVDEAKRRIPDYCPEWTNHNVADPGVALIELFAWMTELTLYRLNQVPERLYLKFLELVGIELLRPRSATTELTFWLSTASVPSVPVPSGTEVATARPDGARPVVFSTDEALDINQPSLSALVVQGADGTPTDRWPELQSKTGDIACFPSEPPAPGESLLIGLAAPLPSHIIRLDLVCPTLGYGVRPVRPPLSWWASTDDGWSVAEVLADSTGGLNRPGSVELRLPAGHAVSGIGAQRAAWVRATVVDRHEDDEPAYAGTPRLSALSAVTLGAVVRAHHARLIAGEALGVSDGTPGQVFTLRHSPVLTRRDDEVVQVVADAGAETWTAVADFARSSPDDHHVQWDDATGEIRFGPAVRDRDGSVDQYGAVPPKGARIVVTRYRSGGGSAGNVGETALRVLQTTVPHIDRVENRRAAQGGADGETIEAAKVRGPRELQHGERAVSAEDFEWFARRATAAVARSHAVPPDRPGDAVELLIVPTLDHRAYHEVAAADVTPLPPSIYEAVSNELAPRRAIGTVVHVRSPEYVGVSVATLLQADTGRIADVVAEAAEAELYRFLHPVVGGPVGKGWAFGHDVAATELVRRLTALPGVHHVADIALFRADLAAGRRTDRARDGIELQEHQLPLSFRHSVVAR